MTNNPGKQFEENFKKSIPDYCLVHRLKDTAQSYNKSKFTKFTWQNPCDFFIYDSEFRLLYCLELKSTKSKYMAFEDIYSDEEQDKMIHKHQIKSLLKFSKFNNVVPGFIFNFRDEKNNMERTYFQHINDFDNMTRTINKTSFNEMDLIVHKAIKINGMKKRVNYYWDIEEFLKRGLMVV